MVSRLEIHWKSFHYARSESYINLNAFWDVFWVCWVEHKFYHKVDINLVFQFRRRHCCCCLPLAHIRWFVGSLTMAKLSVSPEHKHQKFFLKSRKKIVLPHSWSSANPLVLRNMCSFEKMVSARWAEVARVSSSPTPTAVHPCFLVLSLHWLPIFHFHLNDCRSAGNRRWKNKWHLDRVVRDWRVVGREHLMRSMGLAGDSMAPIRETLSKTFSCIIN